MEPLEPAERVHVVPVGYERDRAILPPARLRADRAVLLDHAAETDHRSHTAAVREGLTERGVDTRTVPCDLFDFYDALGTVAETASEFGGETYVNLGSGTKVTAIAGMIACMATGATPYYVRAERYAERSDGVSEGVAAVQELPTYPMTHPTAAQVAVLEYLVEREGASKKRLIEFAEAAGLPPIADRDPSGRRGRYRLLDSHLLDPLREAGYVAVRESGRYKRVTATEAGENTLRAFGYLVEERGYRDTSEDD